MRDGHGICRRGRPRAGWRCPPLALVVLLWSAGGCGGDEPAPNWVTQAAFSGGWACSSEQGDAGARCTCETPGSGSNSGCAASLCCVLEETSSGYLCQCLGRMASSADCEALVAERCGDNGERCTRVGTCPPLPDL